MSANVVFRPAMPDELPTLWSIRTQAARIQCAGHYPSNTLSTWLAAEPTENFHAYLERGHAIVVELDQQIIGYAVIDVGEHELEALFVAPEHFRCGYGAKLLVRAEQMARDEGIKTLGLSAALNAIDFYRAHGYELLEIDKLAHRSGVMLKRGVMRKSLRDISSVQ